MKKYLLILSAVLALTGLLLFVGCSDNNNDSPTNPTSTITVTSPAAGASWMISTSHTIRWTTVNVPAVDVKLLLSGQDPITLASNVSADSFVWTVNSAASTGAQIKDVHHSDATVFGTSGVFTIAALPAIVGSWKATTASLALLGADSIGYAFTLANTYTFAEKFGATEIPESGTYTTVGDSLRFHATSHDGHVVDSTYTRWRTFLSANSQLQLHFGAEGSAGQDSLYTLIFSRLP
jgi:hypothetical protein